MRCDRPLLGQSAVYPGHHITIAFLITFLYPSLEAAEAKGVESSVVLENSALPGSGTAVWEAMRMLRQLKKANQVSEIVEIFAEHDGLWKTCGATTADAFKIGQGQANGVKRLLVERLKDWG